MSRDLFESKLDTPHRVTFTIGSWGIETKFECLGDDSSLCRQIPDDLTCYCEAYSRLERRDDGVWQHAALSEDPEQAPVWHAMRASETCAAIQYIDAEPYESTYQGPDDATPVNGLIDVAWNPSDEYYVWRLAEVTT